MLYVPENVKVHRLTESFRKCCAHLTLVNFFQLCSFFIHPVNSQEMIVISLSSCSRYNSNFKFDQSVFAIHNSPLHILRSVRMTTHERFTITMRPRYLINFKAVFQSSHEAPRCEGLHLIKINCFAL